MVRFGYKRAKLTNFNYKKNTFLLIKFSYFLKYRLEQKLMTNMSDIYKMHGKTPRPNDKRIYNVLLFGTLGLWRFKLNFVKFRKIKFDMIRWIDKTELSPMLSQWISCNILLLQHLISMDYWLWTSNNFSLKPYMVSDNLLR